MGRDSLPSIGAAAAALTNGRDARGFIVFGA
jgi:hypothetical protein